MSDGESPGLELADVSVEFEEVTAIDEVSLRIERGEFFTLVGPSGCGKTTTLRAIAGLETLASGGIRINGVDVTDTPTEDRGVGIVFQNYALFPHMTVRENIGYGLKFVEGIEADAKRERIDELLSLIDLQGRGERMPSALSGGQRQRVALARALAPGPEVLLLDEPLSALDARLRERLRITIRELQRELDITTVYVTHDQSEALAISDRIAVMSEGRIQQVDTPEAVYRRPSTRFVAEFIGDNNLFEGVVSGRHPPRVTVDEFPITLPDADEVEPGSTVTIAVRPEAMSVDPGRSGIEVRVETVEFLGEVYRLHCDWNGRDVLVRSAERRATGETITVGFDGSDAHVL